MKTFFSLGLGLVFLLFAPTAKSQSTWHADLSGSVSANPFTASLAGYRSSNLIGERIKINYGLRISQHSGQNQTFITAPFEYTADELIDTATIAQVSSTSFNLFVGFEGKISNKLRAGFNIDAVGFSFGGTQQADLTYLHEKPATTVNNIDAQPTGLNLLLVGDNDIGSLSSEFYAMYDLFDFMSIRGGLSMFFSEYTFETAGSNDNQRFRNKLAYPFLGVNIKI